MNGISEPTHTLMNIRGVLHDFSQPKIMGILNMTPDSFSDGGKYNSDFAAMKQAQKMVTEGAAIIDIGPQSTRPGAEVLSAKEERQRLGNIISSFRKEFPQILISLDTFYAENVIFGSDEGMDIVNDISAGQFDPQMFKSVAETGLPYILMHVNSSYEVMHSKIQHDDITLAVNMFFSQKIAELKDLGVKDIILDPGFGFGKTVDDQHKLLDECEFLGLNTYPVLIGISRKSFIYKPLGKNPSEVGDETAALHKKVLEKGAKILRVHDVAAAVKTLTEFQQQT